MKYLKLYNEICNESIKDFLKPKSEEDILRLSQNLTDKEKLLKGSEFGILYLVKQAIDSGIDPSIEYNAAIRLAVTNGHLEIIKLLLNDKRVDPSDDDNYLIRVSSQFDYPEIVKFLLKDKRVDPSVINNQSIRFASERGNIEIVKLLLQDKRVDPSDQSNDAIRWASEKGHHDVVNLLLKDKRVTDKLRQDDIDIFKRRMLVKENVNESFIFFSRTNSKSEDIKMFNNIPFKINDIVVFKPNALELNKNKPLNWHQLTIEAKENLIQSLNDKKKLMIREIVYNDRFKYFLVLLDTNYYYMDSIQINKPEYKPTFKNLRSLD